MNTQNTQECKATRKHERVEHSPGPWYVETTAPGCGTVEVWSKPANQPVAVTAYYNNYGIKMLSNARLIAASPDLLEACKAICRELEYAFGGHGQMPQMEAGLYEKARHAITKAESHT